MIMSSTQEKHSERYRIPEGFFCKKCEVYWAGDSHCWICGTNNHAYYKRASVTRMSYARLEYTVTYENEYFGEWQSVPEFHFWEVDVEDDLHG